jgi:hypothetical protein
MDSTIVSMNPALEPIYGEQMAELYDACYPAYQPATIEVLKSLAGAGDALELGVGTGRIAIPLFESGVSVHGVDNSASMLRRLRSKPGGNEIPVECGDFSALSLPRTFSLVYAVANTFCALLTQEEQIRCFTSVARHLDATGTFCLETFIPAIDESPACEITLESIDTDDFTIRMNIAHVDLCSQTVRSNRATMAASWTQRCAVRLRFVWPSELDLLARIAGLRLQQRWTDWNHGRDFARSRRFISVYERMDTPVQGG